MREISDFEIYCVEGQKIFNFGRIRDIPK